jgi:DNA-binding MarR family transcriptional regulator
MLRQVETMTSELTTTEDLEGEARRERPPHADLGALSAAWHIGGPDFLPYRLLLVAKLLDRCTTRLLGMHYGLTVAEWRVLAQLSMDSPSTARQLAERAWVDRAEVSRAVSSLTAKGYVSRRDNPADRRSAILSVTKSGQALYARVWPDRSAFHAALTSRLAPGDKESVDKALAEFARHCLTWLDEDSSAR